jgi:arylformamidase
MLIDISRPIYSGMPHWPGDSETAFRFVATIAGGASVNVGQLSLSVHNGSHADAPRHYHDEGATIDELAFERFIGPALVIDARGRDRLDASLFPDETVLSGVSRVLFRTDAWNDPAVFPLAWPLMDLSLPAWLGERGVQLIGFDVPSVDELESKELLRHHSCYAADLLILENLDLTQAEPGRYELIALPLGIRGGDAAPVRAVLRRTC